ncbi:ATP synthase subunit gamma, mitochondrial [Aphelenchoides fujianensis]|nr:ATP synthase subunit gamma, mitochondrial [Aphelenchoides fujianensis]
MAAVAPVLGEEMAKMEGAAQVMLSQNADPLQRREAESYFLSLREANLPPELCREIIENTAEPYVVFQLAQCLTVQLLRQWNSYTSDQLMAICKYLLEFPLTHPSLPPFAISELFKSAAVIYKRGTNWDGEMVIEPIARLLQSPDDQMQALGLRMIEAICLEFSTMWRSMHHASKKHFEEHVLKKFMELSLACLSRFVSDLDANEHANVCDRFLRVAVIVLQWNFSTTMITAFLKVNLYSINTTRSFCPSSSSCTGGSARTSCLPRNSLLCLMQLAAVMGSVLDRKEKPAELRAEARATSVPPPHDVYVQRCHPHEILSFTTALHRIFSHHPMPVFRRFPPELLSSFVKFIVHWACTLAGPAMHAVITLRKRKDEYSLVDALQNVLCCWSIMLKSTTFAPPIPQLIAAENNRVIESFLKAVLAPPFGERPATTAEAAEEDEELDDHRHYAVILADMGVFCRSSIEAFTQFVIKWPPRAREPAGACRAGRRVGAGALPVDSEREIAVRLDRGFKQKEWVLVDTPAVFSQALAQPDAFRAPDGADPITTICGMVAHWTGVLLHALETQGAGGPFVSAEICRSTVRTFAMTVNFLSSMVDDSSAAFFDESQSPELGPLPHLPATGDFSAALVDFEIRLCFAVFRAFPTEKLLCKTAVCFLLQESEKRAPYIAKSPLLYEQLASITLEKLPSRADFMTCLVNVGANLATSQDRSQMHDQASPLHPSAPFIPLVSLQILQPLAARFLAVADAFQAGNTALASDLVDLLECMSGIAKAAQIESGNILYAYLLPILHSAVRLMGIAADSQPLVEAILDMFKNVATTLFIFVDVKNDSAEDPDNFFNILFQLFENYKISQSKRFNKSAVLSEVEEEEQISDLIALLQIIGCSISKPFIIYTSPASTSDSASCPLCHKTLELILPLLTEDSLRLPALSNAFYRLLMHIGESSANVFVVLEQPLVEKAASLGAAGQEPTRLALETVTIIGRTLSMSTETAEGPFTFALFSLLVPKLCEVAVHCTTDLEMELHLYAHRCLYTIICLNRQMFMNYVECLLNKPENAPNRAVLSAAFDELMPSNEANAGTRQAFKAFNTRFEKFLAVVEPLLVF